VKKHVLLIAASVAAFSFTTSRADEACAPRLVSAETSFPVVMSGTRAGGEVLVGLTVDQNGAIAAAEVAKSSGSPRLDRAAVQSALSRWKFATANCEVAAEPARRNVLVQFQAQRLPTFSAMQLPGVRKRMREAAANGCEVTKTFNGDYVTSCIVPGDARLAEVARR
jgi:TonB family protein